MPNLVDMMNPSAAVNRSEFGLTILANESSSPPQQKTVTSTLHAKDIDLSGTAWRNNAYFAQLLEQHVLRYQHLGVGNIAISIIRHWITTHGGRFVQPCSTGNGEWKPMVNEKLVVTRLQQITNEVLQQQQQQQQTTTTPRNRLYGDALVDTPDGSIASSVSIPNSLQDDTLMSPCLLPLIPSDIFDDEEEEDSPPFLLPSPRVTLKPSLVKKSNARAIFELFPSQIELTSTKSDTTVQTANTTPPTTQHTTPNQGGSVSDTALATKNIDTVKATMTVGDEDDDSRVNTITPASFFTPGSYHEDDDANEEAAFERELSMIIMSPSRDETQSQSRPKPSLATIANKKRNKDQADETNWTMLSKADAPTTPQLPPRKRYCRDKSTSPPPVVPPNTPEGDASPTVKPRCSPFYVTPNDVSLGRQTGAVNTTKGTAHFKRWLESFVKSNIEGARMAPEMTAKYMYQLWCTMGGRFVHPDKEGYLFVEMGKDEVVRALCDLIMVYTVQRRISKGKGVSSTRPAEKTGNRNRATTRIKIAKVLVINETTQEIERSGDYVLLKGAEDVDLTIYDVILGNKPQCASHLGNMHLLNLCDEPSVVQQYEKSISINKKLEIIRKIVTKWKRKRGKFYGVMPDSDSFLFELLHDNNELGQFLGVAEMLRDFLLRPIPDDTDGKLKVYVGPTGSLLRKNPGNRTLYNIICSAENKFSLRRSEQPEACTGKMETELQALQYVMTTVQQKGSFRFWQCNNQKWKEIFGERILVQILEIWRNRDMFTLLAAAQDPSNADDANDKPQSTVEKIVGADSTYSIGSKVQEDVEIANTHAQLGDAPHHAHQYGIASGVSCQSMTPRNELIEPTLNQSIKKSSVNPSAAINVRPSCDKSMGGLKSPSPVTMFTDLPASILRRQALQSSTPQTSESFSHRNVYNTPTPLKTPAPLMQQPRLAASIQGMQEMGQHSMQSPFMPAHLHPQYPQQGVHPSNFPGMTGRAIPGHFVVATNAYASPGLPSTMQHAFFPTASPSLGNHPPQPSHRGQANASPGVPSTMQHAFIPTAGQSLDHQAHQPNHRPPSANTYPGNPSTMQHAFIPSASPSQGQQSNHRPPANWGNWGRGPAPYLPNNMNRGQTTTLPHVNHQQRKVDNPPATNTYFEF